MSSKWIKWAKSCFGIVILLGLFYYLWDQSRTLNWELWKDKVQIPFLLLAIPFQLSLLLFSVLQINLFVRSYSKAAISALTSKFLLTQCMGVYLPSTVSEALIVPFFKQLSVPANVSTGAFVVSKVSNTLVNVLVGLAFLGYRAGAENEITVLYVLLLLVLSPILIILLPPLRSGARRFAKHYFNIGFEYFEIVSLFVRKKYFRAVLIFLVSFAKCACTYATIWVIVKGLGGVTPYWVISGATAIGVLTGILSLTPRNLGVLEGGVILLAGGFGDSEALLLAAVLLSRLVTIANTGLSYLLILPFVSKTERESLSPTGNPGTLPD